MVPGETGKEIIYYVFRVYKTADWRKLKKKKDQLWYHEKFCNEYLLVCANGKSPAPKAF